MIRRRIKWFAVIAGGLWLLMSTGTHAPAQSRSAQPTSTEQINVEAAVHFPYDI